ncbi:MAG: RidA family protein [Acidimicrobiales bacterium]
MSKPVGPYTPIVAVGPWLLTSGQVGLAGGAVVDGGFEPQFRQALANLQAVLATEGATLDDVVKTTVFLTDMDDYGEMNRIYTEVFEGHRPARSAVAVAALPVGALVEIEAMAWHVGHVGGYTSDEEE